MVKSATKNYIDYFPVIPQNYIIHKIYDHDILLGRENENVKHIGNKALRVLLNHCLEAINAAPDSSHKGIVYTVIVRGIFRSGGRFLKKNSHAHWTHADFQTAKERVRNILRYTPTTVDLLPETNNTLKYFKSAYDFDWKAIVSQYSTIWC